MMVIQNQKEDRMKKRATLALAAILMAAVPAFADAAKGQKLYQKVFKEKSAITGAKFAAEHTQAEWKELFANDGAKFIEEYSKKFPAMESYLKGETFKTKHMEHIRDFCIEYAKDSGNVPSC